MSETGFVPHDHRLCITDGLARAEALCAGSGAQLTPVRRRVLEILLTGHRAMGAYEVLEILAREGLGAQPPVAYRALDFLVKQGLAHKIERLNAFVACRHSGAGSAARHAPVFLICQTCGAVAEAEWRPETGELGAAARSMGFKLDAVVAEALGTCPACQKEARP